MSTLLLPFAPPFSWLLDRCYRNLRVVRNPADPFSLHHDGQEVEILSRSASEESDIDIMLSRIDGPPDERWVSWRRSADYRVDLRHFPTRARVLVALDAYGYRFPWAAGSIWSPLTDEQAGRATAAILAAVGEDPAHPVGVVPLGVLGPWKPVRWNDEDPPGCAERPVVCGDYSRPFAWGQICFEWTKAGQTGKYPHGKIGRDRAGADLDARAAGALLWEELTP